jgi:hypothetical protein
MNEISIKVNGISLVGNRLLIIPVKEIVVGELFMLSFVIENNGADIFPEYPGTILFTLKWDHDMFAQFGPYDLEKLEKGDVQRIETFMTGLCSGPKPLAFKIAFEKDVREFDVLTNGMKVPLKGISQVQTTKFVNSNEYLYVLPVTDWPTIHVRWTYYASVITTLFAVMALLISILK